MKTAILIKGMINDLPNNPQAGAIIASIHKQNQTPPFCHMTVSYDLKEMDDFEKKLAAYPQDMTLVLTVAYEPYLHCFAEVLARHGFKCTTVTIRPD